MEALLETITTVSISASAPVDSESTEMVSEIITSEPVLCDVYILSSLPNVGAKVLAILFSEALEIIEARDHQGLRAFCGVASVTRQLMFYDSAFIFFR